MEKNKLKVNTENIPISDITLAGMTWSSDDRQFFKRGLEYNNRNIRKYFNKQLNKEFDKIALQLSEAIIARDRIMFEKMDEQTAVMLNLRSDVGHLKADVTAVRQQMRIMSDENDKVHGELKKQIGIIDKRTRESKVWTIRIIFAVITIIAAIVASIWIHNHYLLEYPLLSLFGLL